MTLNKRAKLRIALVVAVLAGLTSGLAGMLVLVIAWLLIVWGQAPERTENFIGGLPGSNYLLRALARIDRILLAAGFEAKGFCTRRTRGTGTRGTRTRGAGTRRYGTGRRSEFGTRGIFQRDLARIWP